MKRRLRERYGLNYTQRLQDHITHHIKNSTGEFVYRQSLRVTIWDIEYHVQEQDIFDVTLVSVGPIIIRVVYDSNRKNLVTALDRDMDPRNIHEAFF